MNASIAPNANRPARNFTSPLRLRPNARIAAPVMATNGVERSPCSLPTALGIWRLVASE